jgi:hypothetical protein
MIYFLRDKDNNSIIECTVYEGGFASYCRYSLLYYGII